MLLRRAFVLVVLGAAALVTNAAPPPREAARIERLIQHVEAMTEVKFIRNGTEYSSADAGKFLRGKLDYLADKIHTAQDFIEQVATRSGSSGQPYLIRLADGRVIAAAQLLGDELKRMGR
jgi:hypothetical protein